MRKDNESGMAFDKRVVERNIKRKSLSREEYDQYLSSLPDVADQAESIHVSLGQDDKAPPPPPSPPPADTPEPTAEIDDDEEEVDEEQTEEEPGGGLIG